MSDAPLIATTDRQRDVRSGGWTCALAPDERLPEDSWAISPTCFVRTGTYTGKDEELRYAQTMWAVEAFAAKGWLTTGPGEDGLWPITFEDGTVDHAFIVNQIHDLHDLGKAAGELRYDDRYGERSYPRDQGIRPGPKSGYDEWSRYRTGKAECLE